MAFIPFLDLSHHQQHSVAFSSSPPMATKMAARSFSFFFSSRFKRPSLLPYSRPSIHSPTPPAAAKIPRAPSPAFSLTRTLCTSTETPPPPPLKKHNPKLVNFSLPSDSDSDAESSSPEKEPPKPKLPPPYNPFSNKPAVEEPEDPKNLQEVFAKIREDGLMNSAVKMFDGLSQDGLTHEALELFSQIKDKGQMPDVVAHTAVMEAYAKAGQAKEAHRVCLRMLSSGVLPNAYTYRVLINVLAESGDLKMAKKYLGEMVGKGMTPNAGVCVGVFEGLMRAGLEEEGKEMAEMLREKGAVPEEAKVRDALKGKGAGVNRAVMRFLYAK